MAGALQVLTTSIYTQAGGDRAGVPNWAIVVVDGPSSDRASTEAAAARARADGIRLSAIGIGPSQVGRMQQLVAIPTGPMELPLNGNKNRLLGNANVNDVSGMRRKGNVDAPPPEKNLTLLM